MIYDTQPFVCLKCVVLIYVAFQEAMTMLSKAAKAIVLDDNCPWSWFEGNWDQQCQDIMKMKNPPEVFWNAWSKMSAVLNHFFYSLKWTARNKEAATVKQRERERAKYQAGKKTRKEKESNKAKGKAKGKNEMDDEDAEDKPNSNVNNEESDDSDDSDDSDEYWEEMSEGSAHDSDMPNDDTSDTAWQWAVIHGYTFAHLDDFTGKELQLLVCKSRMRRKLVQVAMFGNDMVGGLQSVPEVVVRLQNVFMNAHTSGWVKMALKTVHRHSYGTGENGLPVIKDHSAEKTSTETKEKVQTSTETKEKQQTNQEKAQTTDKDKETDATGVVENKEPDIAVTTNPNDDEKTSVVILTTKDPWNVVWQDQRMMDDLFQKLANWSMSGNSDLFTFGLDMNDIQAFHQSPLVDGNGLRTFKDPSPDGRALELISSALKNLKEQANVFHRAILATTLQVRGNLLFLTKNLLNWKLDSSSNVSNQLNTVVPKVLQFKIRKKYKPGENGPTAESLRNAQKELKQWLSEINSSKTYATIIEIGLQDWLMMVVHWEAAYNHHNYHCPIEAKNTKQIAANVPSPLIWRIIRAVIDPKYPGTLLKEHGCAYPPAMRTWIEEMQAKHAQDGAGPILSDLLMALSKLRDPALLCAMSIKLINANWACQVRPYVECRGNALHPQAYTMSSFRGSDACTKPAINMVLLLVPLWTAGALYMKHKFSVQVDSPGLGDVIMQSEDKVHFVKKVVLVIDSQVESFDVMTKAYGWTSAHWGLMQEFFKKVGLPSISYYNNSQFSHEYAYAHYVYASKFLKGKVPAILEVGPPLKKFTDHLRRQSKRWDAGVLAWYLFNAALG